MPKLELPEEPGTVVAEEIIFNLFPEWWAKFAQKNAAYGDKLSKGGDLGIKAFVPEMNRKMQGIINQVWDGEPQGAGESAREKAMDLIGHLFIFVANLDAEDAEPMAASDQYGRARSALGWPRPKPMTYEQLQAKGRDLAASPSVYTTPYDDERQVCPDDPTHFMEAHMPGGAWFGQGHGGKPSPWQPPRPWGTNPKPNVAVDPMTGDLQPHPLMRKAHWIGGGEVVSPVVLAAPPIHPVRTVNEDVRLGGYDWREWEVQD